MIVDYEPLHLLEIRHQEWQAGANQTMQHAETLRHGYAAYTALCPVTGRALICAGITDLWPNRGMCWASFDFASKPVMVEAFLRMRREIDGAPFKRLEMYVLPGFLQAWRFAQLLGFKPETLMECGSPDGRDLYVFKRIKRGAAMKRLH